MSFDPIEWELSPATKNWRESRVKLWQAINASFTDYRDDAAKYTTMDKALIAAGKHVRGDVRAFVSDLLTRVPAAELPTYLRKFPPNWPDETEILLNEPAVLGLISRSFPVKAQAEKLDDLTVKVAADNALWSKWLDNYSEATGQVFVELAKGGSGVAVALSWIPVAAVAAAAVVGVAYVVTRR